MMALQQSSFRGSALRESKSALVSPKLIRSKLECQAKQQKAVEISRVVLSSTLAVSIGLMSVLPPSAHAEDVYAKRREEMERRKELLAKTREKALALGGQEANSVPGEVTKTEEAKPEEGAAETKFESTNAPAISTKEEAKTKSVMDEVASGNAEREREVSKVKESIKGSSNAYEADVQQQEKIKPAKPGSEFEAPDWLKGFVDQPSKKSDGASIGETQAPPAAPKFSPSTSEPQSNSLFNFQQNPPAAETTPKVDPSSPINKSAPGVPDPAKEKGKPKIGVQPIQKQKVEQKKSIAERAGKRKGPIPMTVAQLLLLGIFGAIGYATFFKEEELNKIFTAVGSAIGTAYNSIGSKAKKSEA